MLIEQSGELYFHGLLLHMCNILKRGSTDGQCNLLSVDSFKYDWLQFELSLNCPRLRSTLLVKVFYFFCLLAFECILSIKQSSPPRWVAMNYRRKVFFWGGVVWIISVLLKFFWLLFTVEVYSMSYAEHKAFLVCHSFFSISSWLCSLLCSNINPHYSKEWGRRVLCKWSFMMEYEAEERQASLLQLL